MKGFSAIAVLLAMGWGHRPQIGKTVTLQVSVFAHETSEFPNAHRGGLFLGIPWKITPVSNLLG
jgi:hypothetical protein